MDLDFLFSQRFDQKERLHLFLCAFGLVMLSPFIVTAFATFSYQWFGSGFHGSMYIGICMMALMYFVGSQKISGMQTLTSFLISLFCALSYVVVLECSDMLGTLPTSLTIMSAIAIVTFLIGHEPKQFR